MFCHYNLSTCECTATVGAQGGISKLDLQQVKLDLETAKAEALKAQQDAHNAKQELKAVRYTF